MEPTPESTTHPTDVYSAPLRGFQAPFRQHERHASEHDVYLTAASGAGPLVARGRTLDESKGGFRAELDGPCPVGEVFQAALVQDDDSPVEPRFARCLRCAIGAEGNYEASFQYLVPVELPRVGH